MKYHIAVIPGDGIGPEIVREAKKVLDKIGEIYGHEFEYEELYMGGCSIDKFGDPLTDETLERAKAADAVLLGAVGGRVGVDSWYELPPEKRPEAGLLKIRKGLGLFCNLRPAILFEELAGACPLKDDRSQGGFDYVIGRIGARILVVKTHHTAKVFNEKIIVMEGNCSVITWRTLP